MRINIPQVPPDCVGHDSSQSIGAASRTAGKTVADRVVPVLPPGPYNNRAFDRP